MVTKSVAVIVDWANLLYSIRSHWDADKRRFLPKPEDIIQLIEEPLEEGEEIFRILFYDCPPFGEAVKMPVSGKKWNLAETSVYKERKRFLDEVRLLDNVALRLGQTRFRGWNMKREVREGLAKGERNLATHPLTDDDFLPNIEQKGTDIKMGLDIAWLALQRFVEKVILFTTDTDLVPAMKFARIHGLRVVIIDPGNLHHLLKEHADEVRVLEEEKMKNLQVMSGAEERRL